MATTNFYGATPGANFKISKVFSNKAEMLADIIMRNQSPIGIGEFVVISYGLPNTLIHQNPDYTAYTRNQEIDLDIWTKTYNGTLWQKIYTENYDDKNFTMGDFGIVYHQPGYETQYGRYEDPDHEGSFVYLNHGIGYRLLAILTGNTPHITIDEGDHLVLNADQFPFVRVNSDKLDEPKISFYLPQSQLILEENINYEVLHANADPTFDFDNSNTKYDDKDILRINQPEVTIKLPRSQQILPQYIDYDTVDPLTAPSFVFDVDGEHNELDENGDRVDDNVVSNIDYPEITIRIPRARNVEMKGQIEDANFGVNNEDLITVDPTTTPDLLKLIAHLPQSQLLQYDEMIDFKAIDPALNPKANLTSDINRPHIQFELPKSAKLVTGNKLGLFSAGTYTEQLSDFPNMLIGDYYLNIDTGFIYVVTAKDEDNSEITFEYMDTLQTFVPTIDGDDSAKPYKLREGTSNVYDPKVPSLKQSYENESEQTGLKWTFDLPPLPEFKAKVIALPPASQPDTTVADGTELVAYMQDNATKATGEDEYTYVLRIPRGARFFTSTYEITDSTNFPAVVSEAEDGDYYINGNFNSNNGGKVYKLVNGVWTNNGETIRGVTGKSLNFIGPVIILDSDDYGKPITGEMDKDSAQQLLMTTYPTGIDDDQLISIEYRNSILGSSIYYWVSYIPTDTVDLYKNWNIQQITGSNSNLIAEDFNTGDENDTSRAYSLKYINKLITDNPQVKSRMTYNADTIDGKLSDIQDQIDQINIDIDDLRDDIDTLDTKIDNTKTNLEGQIANLKTELEGDLAVVKGELQGEIDDLQDQIDNIENAVKTWGSFDEDGVHF